MDQDMDEIRRKRLDKLQNANQSQSQGGGLVTAKKALTKKPLMDIEEPQPLKPPTPKKTITEESSNEPKRHSINSPSTVSNSAGTLQFINLTDSAWESQIIVSLLGKVEGEATADNWERILFEILEQRGELEVLIRLYNNISLRIVKLTSLGKSMMEASGAVSRRVPKLVELRELTLNYISLMMNPETVDMFPANHEDGAGRLATLLATSTDIEQGFPKELVSNLIKRAENITIIFEPTLIKLGEILNNSTYGDYQKTLKAMFYLCSFPEIVGAFVEEPRWLGPDHPRLMEKDSILGPFFSRTSHFPDVSPDFTKKYFGSGGQLDCFDDIGDRNRGNVNTVQISLQQRALSIQKSLKDLCMLIIKASARSKEKMLEYFYKVIRVNLARGKLQVDRNTVCSEGFIHNVMQVIRLLCDPIIDPSFSKLGLIESNFFLYQRRLELDETRINADSDKTKIIEEQYRAANPGKESNFVTDIFFLAILSHHYGLLSAMRLYKSFSKEIEDMQKRCKLIAAQSEQWVNLPEFTRNAKMQGFERLKKDLDNLLGVKLAFEGALIDKIMLENTGRFYDFAMIWLIKAALKPSLSVDWRALSLGHSQNLPLFPIDVSDCFMTLPEFVIDDICEYYIFIMRHIPQQLENHARNEFMAFANIMISNQGIKNPYLKSKLIEILFTFTLPLWRTQDGRTFGHLDAPLISHGFAKEHLVKGILKFYVDVEQTGMSSQFYDKFNIRYNISQILKSIRQDAVHLKRIIELSKDSSFFVKFVNLLMNDTTFLLDESLSKLKEIGNLQIELAQPAGEDQASRTARQEREGLLVSNERQATSYMSLGAETVEMLAYLTANEEIIPPFVTNEIVGRLAAMLDHNLKELAGDRCAELKVENPEKYRFNPKKLLENLVDIFLNLSGREEFVQAVARDGRSYSKAIFARAAGILSRHNIKSADDIQKLSNFVHRVEQVKQNDLAEEEELGDAPEEFLDPLLFTLMEEPVTLPSGVNIDLSTIRSHLLSDAHDPFNRQPLKLEDCVPNPELKKKIEDWKVEMRNK